MEKWKLDSRVYKQAKTMRWRLFVILHTEA